MEWLTILLAIIGIFIVPFIISNYLAKSLRVPDSARGLGIILTSFLAAGTVIFAALQPEQPLTYVVQEGDTVQSIVERYDGLAVKTLIDENNLQTAEDLQPGDTLRIPNPKRLEIKRGVDLSGGVILIYEIDQERTKEGPDDDGDDAPDVDALVEALARRINPGGVKEVVIRKYGEQQVEIIIPDVDDAEVERIKRHITRAGYLRFLIIAKRADHARLVKFAEAQPNARVVTDDQGEALGEWIPIAREEDGSDLKVAVNPALNLTRELRPGVVEVLMAYDRFRVEGSHLRSVSKGYDDKMAPAVNFTMNGEGARKFRALTSSNLPDQQTGRDSRLGIIMDNELISAPTIQSQISDRGQITGGFSEDYVEEMVNVLRAGRLPAVLKPEPITENRIDPLLGQETIEKGGFAIGTSLLAVLVFMAIYYRFAGIVACFALLLNLVLILALMILIRGAFTLPGLAGLVLTVGMSVDANVLIFERIREELKRGAALRMAIRNGFARATTTIVDANITTLITAVVLYAIGTDQLRGFAVTLILGILMSMFTAIYCSRVIFDLAERRRWLKKLTMTQLLDEPKLDLIGKRSIAAVVSVVLIVIGLVGVVTRGAGILDIDFLGGTSVQAQLKEPMPYEEVWDRLTNPDWLGDAGDISLTQVTTKDAPRDTVWKIDTDLPDNKQLQDELAQRFTNEQGESLFKTRNVSFDSPRVYVEEDPADATDVSQDPVNREEGREEPGGAADENTNGTAGLPEISVEADADPEAAPEAEAVPPIPAPSSEPSSSEPTTDEQPTVEEVPADGDASADVPQPQSSDSSRSDLPGYDVLAQAGDSSFDAPLGGEQPQIGGLTSENLVSRTRLTFEQRITKDTLEESIRAAAQSLSEVQEPADLRLSGPDGQADSPSGFREWVVVASVSPEDLTRILEAMQADLQQRPAWRSSSMIGGKVANNTQHQAIAAILISLVCIVGYLWIRFQRVVFGLSAVIALVHDVLITLGAIALSLYLSRFLGVLMIDEFKISLPVVAAFLTIIGYSLNDTIVVFDRIREVKGRSPHITEEIINTSINQTLSRTMLTSATTLIVVLILYIFGGQGIHGFAFALLVGVVVGTYSSIFVASPALLLMSRVQDDSAERGKQQKRATASVE